MNSSFTMTMLIKFKSQVASLIGNLLMICINKEGISGH